ncbi:MAG TPA: bifunctional 4-hydroxy-2-oxoglutarate aldolase/2-dehydro-3-deoxy-phosphogluconate aldolase [Planctomycetota bacterium]|nr:bifunctional 4-hydroxy-2-oxoglutarate aldolase/2-dehydro-3-deoxy-phosphogluconate aldolase [Planctomycetota bacterium]
MNNHETVLQKFYDARASAILRTGDAAVVVPAMEAAVRGGFRIVEFTLTTPGALDAIAHFSKQDDLVVGAGTVLTRDQAKAAVDAGAQFLVSPVVDESVISLACDLGVAALPGAHTPTELFRAHSFGAPFQKLFPAPTGGPDWLRSVLGPLPFLKIVPTNGVDEGNVGDWLDAGAFAVGFVKALFDTEDLKNKRFDRIESRARLLLEATMGVRRPS